MKVILLKDVSKLGKRYEIKEVSDGHALNFLIPNHLAEVATDKAVKKAELGRKQEEQDKKVREDLLTKNIHDINGVVIEMKEKVNDKGHLFAGIHKNEIVPELKKQTRLDIDPEFIDLEAPIKEVGEHSIDVKVADKKATFKLVVTAL